VLQEYGTGASVAERKTSRLRSVLGKDLKEGNAPYSATFLATALFQLGERDAAFEILEAGVRTRSAYMAFLNEPVCDPLREDPRYSRLLQRLGLPA
jgi:hypothetical protein